jgi:hypothetical protein
MQNSELRRELSKIAALTEAIAQLAPHVHGDAIEAPMAELVMLVRDAYEHLIDSAIMAGAVAANVAAATRAEIEQREDQESRKLAAPCGGHQ